MGKNENFQQQQDHHHGRARGFFSWSYNSMRRGFSFKCLVVSILSLSLLLFGIFWVIPLQHSSRYGFDAKATIKLSATIQASFKLPKPVLLLVPLIKRLEYDIFGEIGVPDTKVAILSMHQTGASNMTDVVFGVLPDPINVQTNPLSTMLTKFEIVKFRGGIIVIPMQSAAIWEIQQILFNFTLNNSISDVHANFVQLKNQLKSGLHLKPYENVYVQLTNVAGSTIAPPVTVQASVTSDLGNLMIPRLKQLAQTIGNSHPMNLGLNNSVFGKVKSINLSSYLKGTLHVNPPSLSPTPSPAPSPEPTTLSPYSTLPPANSPRPSSGIHHHRSCFKCHSTVPQAPSPLPAEPGQNIGDAEGLVSFSLSSLLEPPPFASAAFHFNNGAWLLRAGILAVHLLYWLH